MLGKRSAQWGLFEADTLYGNPVAGFQALTASNGFDHGLLRLFLGRIGNDDSAAFLFACIQALHHDAVV